MIDNQHFLNSPSLQFREEPTLQTVTSPSMDSSFLDLLNTDSPTIENSQKCSLQQIIFRHIISPQLILSLQQITFHQRIFLIC